MVTEKPPVGRTMKAAHSAGRTIPNTEIVKAGELVEARFAKGVAPTAAARKVLALLIQKSGGRCLEARAAQHSQTRSPRVA